MTNVIAYIDGFNLYHGLRDRYRHRYLWLDLLALTCRLRPRGRVVAVRYFTAPVRDDPAAHQRQRIYLAALAAHIGPTLEVVHGRFQTRTWTCHRCRRVWTEYEEKETDVNIAASLVADAAAGAADLALVISADADLCPAIRTARTVSAAHGSRLQFFVAFPPRRHSNELSALVPRSFHINEPTVRNAQLPAVVVDPTTGRKYRRPPKWR